MLNIGNISLRAIEPEDVDFILDIENDSSIWHVSNIHNPFSRFDIEQYVLLSDKDVYSAKQIRFIICDNSNPQPINIGIIDVFDFDAHNRRAGIGIIVVEKMRNRGYAAKALDILIDYMMNELNIHQLFCNIGMDNKNSIELFESRGFERVGIKKDWNLVNNIWIDELLLQLINP